MQYEHKSAIAVHQLKIDELQLQTKSQTDTIKNLNADIAKLKAIAKEIEMVKVQQLKADISVQAQRDKAGIR